MQDGLKLNRVCYKQERTFLPVSFYLYQKFCWPNYVTQERDFFLTILVNITTLTSLLSRPFIFKIFKLRSIKQLCWSFFAL